MSGTSIIAQIFVPLTGHQNILMPKETYITFVIFQAGGGGVCVCGGGGSESPDPHRVDPPDPHMNP